MFDLPGTILEYAGLTLPTGFLWADGTTQLRSKYGRLFQTLTLRIGTFTTISVANRIPIAATTFALGDSVYFETTGTLPTGLSLGTTYYVQSVAAGYFTVSTGVTASADTNTYTVNAVTAITITTGSGTHTCVRAPYGIADTTHFYVPDHRGRIGVGLDNIGGSDSGRLTVPNALGRTIGAEKHTLLTAEVAAHNHTQDAHTHVQNSHNHTQDAHSHFTGETLSGGGFVAWTAGAQGVTTATSTAVATNQAATATNQNTTATNQSTGGGGSHNNVQPSLLCNYIIKY
jgi:microcystin-dependent protein